MNVGDYVRTIYGIVKIKEIVNDVMKDEKGKLHYGDFIKSSPNIIDLIEVGDYVNGHTVKMIKEDKSKIDIGEGEDYFWLRNQDIKSIVTKQQFENCMYKVGD